MLAWAPQDGQESNPPAVCVGRGRPGPGMAALQTHGQRDSGNDACAFPRTFSLCIFLRCTATKASSLGKALLWVRPRALCGKPQVHQCGRHRPILHPAQGKAAPPAPRTPGLRTRSQGSSCRGFLPSDSRGRVQPQAGGLGTWGPSVLSHWALRAEAMSPCPWPGAMPWGIFPAQQQVVRLQNPQVLCPGFQLWEELGEDTPWKGGAWGHTLSHAGEKTEAEPGKGPHRACTSKTGLKATLQNPGFHQI